MLLDAGELPELPVLPMVAAEGTILTRYPVTDIELYIGGDGRLEARATDPTLATINLSRVPLKFTTADGWSVTATCYALRMRGFGNTTYGVVGLEARKGNLRKGAAVRTYDFISNLDFEPTWHIPADGGFVRFDCPSLADLSLHLYTGTYGQGLTGWFTWEGTYDPQRKWTNPRMDHLFNLLSFASGNTVNFPIQCIAGERGSILKMQSFKDDTGGGQSPLGSGPIKVRYFLDHTYDNYVKWHEALRLPMAIHWYVLKQNTHYADNQYLLASVMLETLKDAFAIHKGFLQDQRKTYYTLINGKRNNLYFRDLMMLLYKEFHIRGGDLSFIEYRNNVIHKGQAGIPFNEFGRRLRHLDVSIRALMFKIMGYDLLRYRVGSYKVR